MKKIVFTSLAVFIVNFGVLSAQGIFGVKGGLNASNLSNHDLLVKDLNTDEKTKISFNAGFLYRYNLTERIQIQPELLVSLIGDKAVKEEGGNSLLRRTNFSYIYLPIMFRYSLTEKLALELGPQIGYLFEARAFLRSKIGGVENYQTSNFIEEAKLFDIGINLGLAYELESGLGFNTRYNLGLTDIAENNDTNKKFNNSVFQVGLSYLFIK